MKIATVIIPTHNHGPLLHYALTTVLRQTVKDIEIIIIGDGITPETRDVVSSFLLQDERIRFFGFPKAGYNGTEYRDQIIRYRATGQYIFYLSDDDLWLDLHLETMLESLRETQANFTHAAIWHDFTAPDFAETLHRHDIFIGHSFVGHSRSFYLSLPGGWHRRIPQDLPLAEAMSYSGDIPSKRCEFNSALWLQMMIHPDFKPTRNKYSTVLRFPSTFRTEMNQEERLTEMIYWFNKIQEPKFQEGIMRQTIPFYGTLGLIK